MMTFDLSSIQAYTTTLICTRGKGFNHCYVAGIEQTRCGFNQASKTSHCNLFGKNCNWCEIDVGNEEEIKAVGDSVDSWCKEKGGNIVGGVSYPGVKDC